MYWCISCFKWVSVASCCIQLFSKWPTIRLITCLLAKRRWVKRNTSKQADVLARMYTHVFLCVLYTCLWHERAHVRYNVIAAIVVVVLVSFGLYLHNWTVANANNKQSTKAAQKIYAAIKIVDFLSVSFSKNKIYDEMNDVSLDSEPNEFRNSLWLFHTWMTSTKMNDMVHIDKKQQTNKRKNCCWHFDSRSIDGRDSSKKEKNRNTSGQR